MTHTKTSTRGRKFVGYSAIGLTTAGFGAGMAPSAFASSPTPPGTTTTTDNGAAEPPSFVGLATDPGGTATWLGTMKPVGYSYQAICIDSGTFRPSKKTSATTTSAHPDLAYLVSKYSQSQDDITGAALTYIVKQAMDSRPDIVAKAYKNIPASQKAAFDAKVASMKAEAKANVGPYTSKLSFSPAKAQEGDTVAVNGVGVQGANGYVAGFKTTVTLSGPATFMNGSKTWTVTTTDEAQSLKVKVTGSGTVKASETTTVPQMQMYLHGAQAAGYQRMLEYVNGGNATSSASASLTATSDTPKDDTDEVTTTTKANGQNSNKDSKISDTVIVDGVPHSTVSGTDVLYRVKAGTKITKENAEKVQDFTWKATLDDDGAASVTVGDYTVPEDGYDYYYMESTAAGSYKHSDGHTTSWAASTGTLGNTAESVLYEAPEVPEDTTTTVTVSTQVQGQNANKGSKISDTIMGKAPVGAKLSGTDTLYRVKAGAERTKENAEKVQDFTWSATADEDNSYKVEGVGEYTIPEDGYDYFYAEGVNAGSFPNADGSKTTWPAATGTFGDTKETVLYVKPETPTDTATTVTVSTQIQGQNANKGSKISDTIMGTAPAGAKLSGTDTLYRVKAGAERTEANAEKVADSTWETTAGADGSYKIDGVGEYTIPEDGYDYFYAEGVNAGSLAKADGSKLTWPAAKGTFGDTKETVLYVKPETPKDTTTTVTVTTQANGANANKGSVISDSIMGKAPAGAKVSGTDTLYRVKAGAERTQANAEKVSDSTWEATVGADGSYKIDKVGEYTIPEDGYDYFYAESVSAGSMANADGSKTTWPAASGTFGDTKETVLYQKPGDVAGKITVSTQVQGSNANKGSKISDTVMGEAPAGAKLTGTDTLYRVKAGAERTQANAEKVQDFTWSATAGADGKYKVEGVGEYTVPEDGYDYFYAEGVNAGSMDNADGSKTTWPAATGTFGDTKETVLYQKPNDTTAKVTVSTQIQGTNANKGSKISDTIMGQAPAGAKLSGTDTLYRVKAGAERTQANAEKVKDFTWDATAGADGKYTVSNVGEYTIGEDGYDYFYAESVNAGSFTNADGSKITWDKATGNFGDTTETVLYQKPSDTTTKVTVSTQIQGTNANKGSKISDTIMGQAPAGAKVSGTDTLYRVKAGAERTEANAEKVADSKWEATAGADGKYTATKVGEYTIPEDGYDYFYAETVDAGSFTNADGSKITWDKATGNFGDTTETVLYQKPNDTVVKVTVSTKAQGANANKGSVISDTIMGEAPAGTKLSGTDVLYRVKAGAERTEANAEKVKDFTWSATAGADGKYSVEKVGEYTIGEDGYDYFYAESVDAGSVTNADGSKTTWSSVKGNFGDTSETVLYVKPETPKDTNVKVTVSTQIQGANANKGSKISDTINGVAPAGAKLSGTDTLYRVKAGTARTVENAEKVKDFTWEATAGADGKYTATNVGEYTIPEDGYDYFYAESVNAGSFTNADGSKVTWDKATGTFGDTTETVLYQKPKDTVVKVTVSTQAVGTNANKGSKIHDKIVGTGPVGVKLTGTDVLYRVKAGAERTQANAEKIQSWDWNATVGADGKYSAQTPDYTVPEDGYDYFYVESVNGGSVDNPDGSKSTWTGVTGTFGEKSETVLYVKPTTPPVTPPTTPPTTPPVTPPATHETPKPHTPVTGPKIQTDHVGQGSSTSTLALDALAVAGLAAAAGGALVVRRRKASDN